MTVQRLPPLGDPELPEALRDVLAAWPYRLHRTLAHSPESLVRWMPWAEHILLRNRLPARDREIAILRVAWNAACAYEWGMHAMVARRIGMTDADLSAVVEGAASVHWHRHEAALISAVDQLMTTHRIDDPTWAVLAAQHEPAALIDFLYVTGQFMTIAWILNGLAIAPEEGLEPLPARPDTRS